MLFQPLSGLPSLIPSPFPAPDFDCILQAIKNWSQGKSGNEAMVTLVAVKM